MNKALLAAFLVAFASAGTVSIPASAAGPGSCGKGKVWDADQNKCVPKPRSSGSGSGSHH